MYLPGNCASESNNTTTTTTALFQSHFPPNCRILADSSVVHFNNEKETSVMPKIKMLSVTGSNR